MIQTNSRTLVLSLKAKKAKKNNIQGSIKSITIISVSNRRQIIKEKIRNYFHLMKMIPKVKFLCQKMFFKIRNLIQIIQINIMVRVKIFSCSLKKKSMKINMISIWDQTKTRLETRQLLINNNHLVRKKIRIYVV